MHQHRKKTRKIVSTAYVIVYDIFKKSLTLVGTEPVLGVVDLLERRERTYRNNQIHVYVKINCVQLLYNIKIFSMNKIFKEQFGILGT